MDAKQIEHITKWVYENSPGILDKQHVIHCIVLWMDEYAGIDSQDEFIKYLAAGNFYRAILNADNTNKHAMPVYASYRYNILPMYIHEEYIIKNPNYDK
jgi:hypothetical protein